jgi:hypothetical protein
MDVKSDLKVGVHKYLSIYVSILGNFRSRHEITGPNNQDWGSSIWNFEFYLYKPRNSNLYVCDLQRQSIKMPAK